VIRWLTAKRGPAKGVDGDGHAVPAVASDRIVTPAH